MTDKYKDWIVRFYASHDDIPEGHHDGEIVRELVRCEDCTKYKHWECPIEQAGYRPKEDGYCFDAERKADND